jgi:hypothetical protein
MTRPPARSARLSLSVLEDRSTPAAAPTTVVAAAIPISTAAGSAPAAFISAEVTTPHGTVSQGSVTFTALSNAKPIGSPLTLPVSSGVAVGEIVLPAGTPAGMYTLNATYNGTAAFAAGTDAAHTIQVTAPATKPSTTGTPMPVVTGPTTPTLPTKPVTPVPVMTAPTTPTFPTGPGSVASGPGAGVFPLPGPVTPGGQQVGWGADPNDLVGPGSAAAAGGDWGYTVQFENDGVGAAQQVVVTEQLDPHLDFATFRFGEVGFGSVRVAVPAEVTHYQTAVPYQTAEGRPIVVPVTLDFDVASGRLTMTMDTTDPTTGARLAPYTGGFLKPDDATHGGEGFISYTVRPRADAASGMVIAQRATVVFDGNDPVNTPTVRTAVTAPPAALSPDIAAASVSSPVTYDRREAAWPTGDAVVTAVPRVSGGSGVTAGDADDSRSPQTWGGVDAADGFWAAGGPFVD